MMISILISIEPEMPYVLTAILPGIDTGCLQHRYTDFRYTNLDVNKFEHR